ncbi:hypothetical protein OAK75_11745 [Bacteriovoracales bacterium]|nr:hypothetical protein [Bacteriovoracales bacterium]
MPYKLSLRIENGLFTHTFKAEIKRLNDLFACPIFGMNKAIDSKNLKI